MLCTFQLQSVTWDTTNPLKAKVNKEIAMQPITKESHSRLYENGHGINNWDTEGLYTMVDKSDAVFVNTYDN